MVVHHVVMAELIEELEVSDHWLTAWVAGIDRGVEESTIPVVGVIQPHIDFTANDILFFFELIDGEARFKDHLSEYFEEGLGAFGRAINVVNGAVECGVSIPLAAGGLHGIGDRFAIVACRAFEDHVLEHMGEAGAEEVALVDAACFHPCLCADDRSIRVGIKDNGEAIVQGVNTGLGSGKLHGRKVVVDGGIVQAWILAGWCCQQTIRTIVLMMEQYHVASFELGSYF